jgi:glycosyltransferase involved in cell wall biosynthesis
LFFTDPDTLRRQMELTLADLSLVEQLRAIAQNRVKQHYSWDAVTDAYEKLFREMITH